ncbi:MAG: UDP-N-acetylglucosamine 1-carboxyvinyltransferase [Oscillospiraceae bacterium]|nr:UDP-N-acetylglucosamine 1-carboxyvinyltransferase [Oscillospiraceae bacterium]
MTRYLIRGAKPLRGEVEISGAKNAAVAIIPAALLVRGTCRIENLPQISDVFMLLKILQLMGAEVKTVDSHTVDIDCSGVTRTVADFDLMQRIRASYYLIGALLGRFGTAGVAMPGGCNFGGTRPIDQHIKGFRAMGAVVETSGGLVEARAKGGKLHGSAIFLDMASVGATINLMLAAVLAEGRTVIENAAREPHIVDLANFLNSMGADIRGAGTNVIKIRGVKELRGGFYSIIPDQIEAGTYLAAVAGTGGEVLVRNVIPKHLDCITGKLQEMGVDVVDGEDSVLVRRKEPLRCTNVKTMYYPGFPTDMQPQIAAVLATAQGTSIITEGVWATRYKYVSELEKMGARITVDGRIAIVEGVPKLTGARLEACDLRAGAAMVIAGLCAEGVTEIGHVGYIERGYENIIGKLRNIGADIMTVNYPGEQEDEILDAM